MRGRAATFGGRMIVAAIHVQFCIVHQRKTGNHQHAIELVTYIPVYRTTSPAVRY